MKRDQYLDIIKTIDLFSNRVFLVNIQSILDFARIHFMGAADSSLVEYSCSDRTNAYGRT